MKLPPRLVALLLGLLIMGGPRAFAAAPLGHAHAHNDYEHARPLDDALDQGFTSVEADVFLIDGQLLVAHDREQTHRDRTLEALYLDPLRRRVAANAGRVFRDGPPFTLLIDLKADGGAIYARLREVLEEYRPMLSAFGPDHNDTNAVTVILSGDRPRAPLEAETNRLAALDGRLADLEANPSPHLVPLVSDNWRNHFAWRGTGPFPEAEHEKLARLVQQAHAQGRRLRFWAAPDTPESWAVQLEAGVDLINTDRLADLRAFLEAAHAQ